MEAPRQPSVVELWGLHRYLVTFYVLVFSSGAVETHTTLKYQKIKGDKISVEAPRQPSVVELWRPTQP